MANEIKGDIVIRGADKAGKDLKNLGDSAATAGAKVEDLGKDTKATGSEVDVLTKKTKTSADGLGDMAKEAGFLDREINRLQGSIASLTKELDSTGDTSLLKDIRRDKRQLGTFTKLSASIGGAAADAVPVGVSLGTKLAEGIATGVKAGGPWVKGALAVLAASAAPAVGALVAAAVLGGVGAGGMVGGIALAAKDPRVEAAGKDFAKAALSDLQNDIGASFAGPAVAALTQLKGTVGDLSAGVAPEMRDLAKEVGPLVRGLDALGRNALPGVNKALDAAAPLMRTVSAHLPRIGTALSNSLDSIASGGDGAVKALDLTLTKVEQVIEGTGELIGWLGRSYDTVSNWGAAFTGGLEDVYGALGKVSPFFGWLAGKVAESNDELEGSEMLLRKIHEPAGAFGEDLKGIGTAAGTAAEQLDAMQDNLNELFGITNSVKDATLAYEQSIDDLTEGLADGKKTFDMGSQAGRDNWQVVRDNVDAINDLRQANIENGMSVESANAIADAQLAKLDATVAKFGKTSAEVRAYIEAIRSIPTLAELRVTVSGAEGAKAQLLALKGLLGTSAAAANVRANADYVSGRASGGPIAAGVPYIVGEQGPELIIPSQSGTVMTAAQTAAMQSGASGGSAVSSGGGATSYTVGVASGMDAFGTALVNFVLPYLTIEVANQGGSISRIVDSRM